MGKTGVEYIFEVVARILSEQFPETSAHHVGPIIIEILYNVGKCFINAIKPVAEAFIDILRF